MQKLKRFLPFIAMLIFSVSISVYAESESNGLEIETLDLRTGEISNDFLPEYSENSAFPATQGSEGTLPAPYVIIGDDDRTIIEETTRIPYRYIGRLEIRYAGNSSSITVGTGFLVGKSTILTAAHCVYSGTQTISSITFIPGKNGSTNPYGTYTAAKIHVPTNYKEAVTAQDETNKWKYDYALIELNEDIGSQLGYFALGGYNTQYTLDELVGKQAIVVGYPGNSGGKMYRHKSDIIGYNTDEYQLYYTTDTTGGQSGSPVFIYTGTGAKYYVVGIHNGGSSSRNIGRYITMAA